MKLHINFVPVIVTVLFLMTMVGFQNDSWDAFVAEQGPRALLAPPPDPATLPAFTDAFGFGAVAGQTCRDSVINGSWDVKHVLGDATVYEDGSACFEVPARTPVYFQALDVKVAERNRDT